VLILFVLLFSLHESEDGRARFSVALVGFVIVEKAVSRMKFGKIHETLVNKGDFGDAKLSA